jgi:hypothetical protein
MSGRGFGDWQGEESLLYVDPKFSDRVDREREQRAVREATFRRYQFLQHETRPYYSADKTVKNWWKDPSVRSAMIYDQVERESELNLPWEHEKRGFTGHSRMSSCDKDCGHCGGASPGCGGCTGCTLCTFAARDRARAKAAAEAKAAAKAEAKAAKATAKAAAKAAAEATAKAAAEATAKVAAKAAEADAEADDD